MNINDKQQPDWLKVILTFLLDWVQLTAVKIYIQVMSTILFASFFGMTTFWILNLIFPIVLAVIVGILFGVVPIIAIIIHLIVKYD